MNTLFCFAILVMHFHSIHADSRQCPHTLDLAFALDSSYSVGHAHFQESLELVKAVSSSLAVGPNMARVSLVQFSDIARVEFYLNESTSIGDVVKRLRETNYTEGNTQTGSALRLLREDVFTLEHGDRSGVDNVVVLITDGPSSDHDILVNQSTLLNQSGVTVVAVSVGFLTHPEELEAIAGHRIIRVTSYEDLVGHTEEIVQLIKESCGDVTTSNLQQNLTTSSTLLTTILNLTSTTVTDANNPTTEAAPGRSNTKYFKPTSTLASSLDDLLMAKTISPLPALSDCRGRAVDIVVVVDSSNSVGLINFQKTKTFLLSLVDRFDIGRTVTRFGVIVFSDDARVVIKLGEFHNKIILKDAIQNIQYTGGGTNTAAALKLLGSTAFSQSPRHGGIPRVGVVLTDGLSRNTLLTRLQAQQLHGSGVQLFAIGIGDKVSRDELKTIGTRPSDQFVIAMADFNVLSHSGAKFISSACQSYPRWQDLILTSTSPPAFSFTSLTGRSSSSSSSTPPVATNGNSPCFDVHSNCHAFGRDVCSDYEQWARAHCAATCKFCSRNVSEEACEDNIRNCRDYGTYACEDPYYAKWAWENCAAHCGLCDLTNGTNTTLSTPSTATEDLDALNTVAPTSVIDPDCSDTIPDCANYGGQRACVDYHAWASVRCREYCGFCSKFVFINATTVNGVNCPEWKLPVECTMDYWNGTCCPTPRCPDGYIFTAKKEK